MEKEHEDGMRKEWGDEDGDEDEDEDEDGKMMSRNEGRDNVKLN